MQYSFDDIWKSIQSLPKPDVFSDESWKSWYLVAWEHLTNADLLNLEAPIDITRCRLRGFALCWLAHDFCAASFGEESSPELYWNDWLSDFQISPLDALVVGTESQPCGTALSGAVVFQSDDFATGDDVFDFSIEESESDLIARVCCLAAMRLRPAIVNALVSGFGDESLLFANLYVASRDLNSLEECEQDRLNGEIEEIESELQHESDPKFILRLTSRLESLKEAVASEILVQRVRNKAIDAALNGPIYIGDEETCSRLNGLDWCREGCRVVVAGIPSVQRE